MIPDTHLTTLEERFLRYVRIDSQSDEDSTTLPSTPIQWDMLRLLADELRAMGAADVVLTETGFTMGTIPATPGYEDHPTVAFLAHVDTAPGFPAAGVRPLVHRRFDGAPITLPDNPAQVLDPADNPYLAQKVGEDIITASGSTLLGADDKAGVAIIMTMAAMLLAGEGPDHGPIRVCFTPDEEIGSGIRHLPLATLGANVAYTLDGGDVGQCIYETFSADKAVVTIEGVAIHPGRATGKLVNALYLAARFVERLPQQTMTPEVTADREGFIHLTELRGTAASAELRLILRDFEREGLAEKGALVRSLAAEIQALEPRARVTCTISKQYRNMRYWLEEDMTPVELAFAAARRCGIEPVSVPARGGTDGSQLTEMGLPTPNLFTGMQNVHGPLEWISLQDMGRATAFCLELAGLWAREGADYRGWRPG